MISVDPALFRADLEAKPAALRALATHLATHRPWEFVRATRRVVFLGAAAKHVLVRKNNALAHQDRAPYALGARGSVDQVLGL